MKLKVRIMNDFCRLTDSCLRLGGAKFHEYVIRNLYSMIPYDGRDPGHFDIEILLPSIIQPEPGDLPIVERIFAAYKKAKKDQSGADAVFLPSSLWRYQIDNSYGDLISACDRNDIDLFHRFLSNFGASENFTGINYSSMVRDFSKTRGLARHFERLIIGQMVRWWMKSESRGRDISALSPPRHGNQAGARVNGHFIGVDSVLNDYYGRMIANLIPVESPVIAEIGGGYGILIYSISRHLGRFRYLGFDLPETLCCATYYLMKCFPGRRFLLYGEGLLDEKAVSEYDFIFMPSCEIGRLPDRSVDIALNMSSLGEMNPDTCRRFVSEICRVSNGFWHMNHEFNRNAFADGTASLVNSEYPVPGEEFRNVVRYIESVNAVYKGRFDEGYDIYGYYYARR